MKHLSIYCLLAVFMTGGIANAQTQDEAQVADTISANTTAVDTDTTTVKKKYNADLRHELSIYGGAGLSVINYALDKSGSRSDGSNSVAGILGIGYTWNINDNFGVVTGVEMSRYNGKTSYDVISGDREYGTGDDRFKFSYSMRNYIEEQSTVMISIPAMAQYSAPLSDPVTFYLAAGFKFGLPVNAKATIFPGDVSTSGYYYFENQRYYDDLPDYGFTNSKPSSVTSDVALKVSMAMSIESGVRFSLMDNMRVYTGAYLDYGLNNIRSKHEDLLINYHELNPSAYTYSSVLNTAHADKIKIFAVGLKLKISFGW
jgi:opacity protein-like surface antigen